jgi:hypothetical protein
MQPLAVDPRALRVMVGPDIKIVPGRGIMARVVAAEGGRGSLSIAGFLLDAELPGNVHAGDDLRLVVRDVNTERVLLSISDQHEGQSAQAQTDSSQAAQGQPAHGGQAQPSADMPPPVLVPLPGGGSFQVTERDAGGGARAGGGGSTSLALRYDAPALGAVDLHFSLDAGALRLSVTVPHGQALELARADADQLRQSLAGELSRAVSVTVTPRREPLDVYA